MDIPYVRTDGTYLGFVHESDNQIHGVVVESAYSAKALKIIGMAGTPDRLGVRAIYAMLAMYRELSQKGYLIGTDVLWKNKAMQQRVNAVFGVTHPYGVIYLFGSEE